MGEAIARLFVAEGAKVLLADVLDAEGEAVADDLGDAAAYFSLDVADEQAWVRALEATAERFGTPDVLVNNAGVLRPGPLTSLDPGDLRVTLDVNLVGPILGMKVVGAAMADAGRGSIVNVSSTGGMVGMSMISAYVASKWGLRGVTKAAAIELGHRGVRVNSVHPGGVATAMAGAPGVDAMVEPPLPGRTDPDPDPVLAEVDARSAHQPVARIGRPIEVARAALFLASDESSYCTGSEFVVDGGAIAGLDLREMFGG
jgi:3alpha(or 20beta)-hydroxysteroid dehydrogenase